MSQPELPMDDANKNNSLLSRRKPKRVCMIAYTFYEHDNRVRRYAETLVKRGDQVEVIALSGPFNLPPKEEICGVTVYRIQRREMKEKGIWSYAWPLIRFLFASSRFLAKLSRHGRYDLIHIHNMPDFLVFAAWHAKLRGAKLILDLHDLTPELFSSKFRIKPSSPVIGALKLIEKMSCRFVDHVIISNHIWSEVVEARSVRKDRCSVMINNVDPAIFYRRPRERKDSKFIIVFHGAYQWHQGLDIAIEAFALVTPELPNAELHFYGGGAKDMTDGLMELSKRLGLDGSVKFCGHTPFDSIPAIIANADLGVVPKRADSFGNEAYSTKIMEFMSQGVPVVLSKTKVDTFYFQEGTVHFFPSGDIRALATAILNVAKDDELRSGLIARGLEYVELNGWNAKKQEYLDVVDGICGSSLSLAAKTNTLSEQRMAESADH